MRRRDPLANPEPLIRRVYAYLADRIGDGPDAEDVTSEVLERALHYRDSYDPSRGEPATWLIGIARYRLKLGRRPTVPLDEAGEPTAPGDLEAESSGPVTLKAALTRLDERDAELIALRYGADLTARQIGETLGMRTNAVEVALDRALGRLRVALTQDESTGNDSGASDGTRVTQSSRGRFWNRSKASELEDRLRSERPAPRPEFLRAVASRVASGRARASIRLRVAVASAWTLAMLVAVASAGGLSHSASGAQKAVQSVGHVLSSASKGTHANNNGNNVDDYDAHEDQHVKACKDIVKQKIKVEEEQHNANLQAADGKQEKKDEEARHKAELKKLENEKRDCK